MTKPPNLADLEEQIERLSIQKDEAVRNAEYEEAARLRDQAETLRKKKEDMQKAWREKAKEVDGVVDEEVIAEVISKMTGVPLTRLENVILSPHWSASTTDVWKATGRAMVDGMLRAAHGEVPENVINRDVLEREGFRRKLARFAGG